MKEIPINSLPIKIVVKPRSRWAMGRYIKSLIRQLGEVKPSQKWEVVKQREAILSKLAYTCDNRIVPTLIELMYKNYHNNEVFTAREAFLCYLPCDEKVKQDVLKVAKTCGLAPGLQTVLEEFRCDEEDFKEIIKISLASNDLDIMGEGIKASQDHPDDVYMSALISIATDPNMLSRNKPFHSIERVWAIYAIAYNRTDEGVLALKTLLNDTDEYIRKTTAEAIQAVYKRHPVYPKYTDDEYTAKLVIEAMDFNNPKQIPMIAEILRSRTEESVKAIEALLQNPDLDISIAETDAGVKIIRDFLRNPDKNFRDMVSNIIRVVYKRHPGRPLRDNDFGEEFRKNPEERKRRF